MKRTILIISATLFLIILGYLIINIINRVKTENQIKVNYYKLPTFSFYTLNNTLFKSVTIKEGPILIIYFHPECEHCQYELSEIVKSQLVHTNLWILLVTPAEINSVLKFKKEINLIDSDKLITLIDEKGEFQGLFGRTIIPTSIIYDKDLRLVKIFNGEVRPETIQKMILGHD
jgi:hypothetical protein